MARLVFWNNSDRSKFPVITTFFWGSWLICWELLKDKAILFTKKELIRDSNKEVIGHKLDVRVRKSKGGAFDKKDVITLNFYYEGGFNEIDEYAQIFCETGVVKVGGAGWITFPDRNAEEKKVQGTDKFAEYLKTNPEDFEFLKQQL